MVENSNSESIDRISDVSFKQRRKDELKRQIHDLNKNPLIQNEVGVFSYRIIFECLNNLILENSHILTLEEEERLMRYKKIIEEFLILKSPHKLVSDHSTKKRRIVFDGKNWMQFKELLYKFQTLVFSIDDKDMVTKSIKSKTKEY